jgi:hypothetical protein
MFEDPRRLAEKLTSVLNAVSREVHEAGLASRGHSVVVKTRVHLNSRYRRLLGLLVEGVEPYEVGAELGLGRLRL